MEEYRFIYNNRFIAISGPYTWDPDIVGNLGETWGDYLEGKYLMLNEEQTNFLNENPSATPEEVWNLSISTLANSSDINELVANITDYDSSDAVNTFYVNDIAVWFNKETRTSINNSISIEKEVGKDTTVLWINSTSYTLPVDTVKQMLIDLELYAMECYNNTQRNIAEAKTLTLKEEVNSFDITKGYPEKLKFNL